MITSNEIGAFESERASNDSASAGASRAKEARGAHEPQLADTLPSNNTERPSSNSMHAEGPPTTPFVTEMSEVLKLPFAEARALALREFDRFFLSAALERNAGNIARTARALGLHRQSLQKLMTRRGLKSRRGNEAAGS